MSVIIDDDNFEYELDDLDESAVYDVKIKVVGVGGGGCNALEHMAKLYAKEAEAAIQKNGSSTLLDHIEFIAMNTDVAALKKKDKTLMRRLQIGKKTCKGRGAGGRPEVAAESARESREEIEAYLKDASIVFIAAGMGGGTGTGAAPVIAEIAKDMGIITVGIVTKPFEFERELKMNQAMKGIDEMRKHVDALLIIPNERLLKLNEKMLSFLQAFEMVDDVLYRSVKIVSDVVAIGREDDISKSRTIDTDFADLCSILEEAGDAHIAIGTGTGTNKIQDAVDQVVNSPLLETSIANATKLLINITLSGDSSITDYRDAAKSITDAAAPDVNAIQGVTQDTNLSDTIIISVIAAGFKKPNEKEPTVIKTAVQKPAGASMASVSFETSDSEAVEIVTSETNDELAKIITNTLGSINARDRFADIEGLFSSKKNRDEE